MNNILKLGVILGVLSIALQLIYKYALGYEFMFSTGSWVSLGITAVLCIVLGRQYFRDPEDGTLSYGEAVKNLFLSLLLGTVIGMVGAALLLGNDQELNTAYKEYSISAAESGARLGGKISGASEADIERAVEDVRTQYDNGEIPIPDSPYSFSMLPMNLLMSAVMSIIFALILAIFIKKNDKAAIA